LFVECAYNLEVCLPFSSALKKDMRVHLMDGIGYQLVDPAYQLVIPPTCPCGMEITFFNDISPDTGWCQFPIDNNYTFSANRRDRTWKDLSEGTWNFANYEDWNSHGVSSDDKTGGRDNVFDCERDKLEAFFPFDWIQAAGARKRETDMGSSTDTKGKNLDYGLIGSPELFDWTFEGYPRTDLLDRTYHGILTTRAASEKNSSLVELLFRFLPTVLVNTVGSTCDSRGTAAMLRVFTWKDTGWYSQFLRIQYFAWAPRFPSTMFSYKILEGLFWRILLLKLFVNFMYLPVAWFDTGWPFLYLFGWSFLIHLVRMRPRPCLRTGIVARGGDVTALA